MSVIRRIFIPPDVTANHRTVVQRYVERIGELSSSEWPLVIEAFNLLRHAVVVRVDDRAYTFAQIYEELVDARYLDIVRFQAKCHCEERSDEAISNVARI